MTIRSFIRLAALGAVLMVAPVGAHALPVAPADLLGAAPAPTNVAGGCGLGWHRGPFGGCRRNWGPLPGYGLRCWYRPTPWGLRKVCGVAI